MATKEILQLIIQYLRDNGQKETCHILEQESRVYFDVDYFYDLLFEEKWDEADKYLSAFTKMDDNPISMKLYLEIRKRKYVQALDRIDIPKAFHLYHNELEEFSRFNKELIDELFKLLTKSEFRVLPVYSNPTHTRFMVATEMKLLAKSHPIIREKAKALNIEKDRMMTLIQQSMKWQHHLCQNAILEPVFKTILEDHKCEPSTFEENMINRQMYGSDASTSSANTYHQPANARIGDN